MKNKISLGVLLLFLISIIFSVVYYNTFYIKKMPSVKIAMATTEVFSGRMNFTGEVVDIKDGVITIKSVLPSQEYNYDEYRLKVDAPVQMKLRNNIFFGSISYIEVNSESTTIESIYTATKNHDVNMLEKVEIFNEKPDTEVTNVVSYDSIQNYNNENYIYILKKEKGPFGYDYVVRKFPVPAYIRLYDRCTLILNKELEYPVIISNLGIIKDGDKVTIDMED